VRRPALGALASLRRYEERMARWELALASKEAAIARSGLGPLPPLSPIGAGLSIEAFLAARATSHISWAAWGERLSRAEQAATKQEAAQQAWANAASDLKAIERLAERRARRAKQEAARAAQAELDDVATRQWRRSRRGPTRQP